MMRKGQVTDQDQQKLAGIRRIVETRKRSYGWAWTRTLLSRREDDNEWKHTATRIDFLSSDESKPEKLRWEYHQAMLVTIAWTPEDCLEFLKGLVEEGRFALPGLPLLQQEGSFGWASHLCSRSRLSGISWSTDYYQFRLDNYAQLTGGHLVSVDCPAFADAAHLLKEKVTLDTQRSIGAVEIFLPNFEARIIALTIGRDRISVSVESPALPIQNFVGKVHVTESWGGRHFHKDVEFSVNTEVVPIGFTPGEVYVGLLSRESNELIDFRHFRGAGLGASETDDVQFERTTEEEIEALIRGGENRRVEFKLKVSDGIDLAETVVAFANSSGGTILVGVDDRSNIVGCEQANVENTIRNILGQHCEPPIYPQVAEIKVPERAIVVITVKEGEDKPYTVRGKGPFVRAGSTDRVATRDELDGFYVAKQERRPAILG